MISEMKASPRQNYGRIPNLVELQDLIATQVESFNWFRTEGLRELFDEINPITDYTGKNCELKFLLKALELDQLKGKEHDREAQRRALNELFQDVDSDEEHRYIDATFEKDVTLRTEEALIELYKRIRPGDPATVDNARNLLQSLFFNPRRFDLGRVGRYKVDKRLGRPEEEIRDRVRDRSLRILEKGDFIAIIRKLVELNNQPTAIADEI